MELSKYYDGSRLYNSVIVVLCEFNNKNHYKTHRAQQSLNYIGVIHHNILIVPSPFLINFKKMSRMTNISYKFLLELLN